MPLVQQQFLFQNIVVVCQFVTFVVSCCCLLKILKIEDKNQENRYDGFRWDIHIITEKFGASVEEVIFSVLGLWYRYPG